MKQNKSAGSQQITVLIADDHLVVREGLAALVGLENDLQIVAQAADGDEAVKLFDELRPQISLIDLNMPVLDGTATITRFAVSTRKRKLSC